MNALELHGVGKRFGTVTALEGIGFAAPSGSRTAVIGPSGSGKSTLLRILAGFESPDTGQVRLDGDLISDGPAIVAAHRRGIGLVAQEGALFPHLSVADNIGFGIGWRTKERAALILELASLVGLDAAMLARGPDALSGGQQQRVALARALARRPRLMLLDEPFSALDTGLRVEMRKVVADILGRAGVTTILVTHDQAEALSFAEQIVVLHHGRLLQAGPPRQLYLQPGDEIVARLLGDAVILDATVAGGLARCALGRLAVDECRDGPARLMLRPEQISILPAGPETTLGTVQTVEFGGGACTVAVRVLSSDDRLRGMVTLMLKVAQNVTPRAGETVGLQVMGRVHVFKPEL